MAEIERAELFGKLNPLAYRAVESATVFCKMRGNPYVELVHWIHQLFQLPDTDLHHIVRHFACNESRLSNDILQALDQLPRGASSISDLSAHLEEATERAWVYASLLFHDQHIRTGYLVAGLVKTPNLRRAFGQISGEFNKIKPDELTDRLVEIVAGSPEDPQTLSSGEGYAQATPGEASGSMAPAAMGKREALARFTVDLTGQARRGELDPIVGRDMEIRQVIDILMRRRQNNPILTGEAGVGKTAVVEGFALRLASGDVPPALAEVDLLVLDIGLLQAGASMKGEFENRLRQVIDEVQASPKPIILFVDEAHTLIGAGGAAGTGDAANLLKPALARGTLRTIAATTWAEYKKHIEKDPALTRRFQIVKVEEPSEDAALLMMRAMATPLEAHHRVQVLDEALDAAVSLSHRYIPARQLPDKSISLLDTACARVAISQHGVPAAIEDARRRIESLKIELDIIERETQIGMDTQERRAVAEERLVVENQRLAELEEHFGRERELVDQILELRAVLRGISDAVDQPVDAGTDNTTSSPPQPSEIGGDADAQRQERREQLQRLQAQLAELQGENPLILPSVDEQAVASVVADWTGIPVGRMVKNEIAAVLSLADRLNERVIGQRHALEAIARRIQTSRANLDNPNRPIGVFMLVGPSGVGKTETALALAEALYGGEQNTVTINMSEFQEAHTVSTLKGAPPGYVGYGEGGILTEAVRRRPYSVVLLDEVEKAHPDVHEIFFQVFDKGQMEDGEGRLIDFKNTVILLTSNVGSDLIMDMCRDPDLMPEPEGISKALREPLLNVFPAALLGRLVTVPYYPITDEMLKTIIQLQLGRIEKRLRDNHRVAFEYDDQVIALITERCTELESGARMVDSILTNTLLPEISREFLSRLSDGKQIARVKAGVSESQFHYDFKEA